VGPLLSLLACVRGHPTLPSPKSDRSRGGKERAKLPAESRYTARRMDASRTAGGPSVARTIFVILAGLAVLTGLVFAVAPWLDLAVASFFHEIGVRDSMPRLYRAIEVARTLEPLVTTLAIAPAIAVVAIKMFWPKRPTLMPGRAALFLILSLVLGPGLLVNAVFKDHWSRPRPGMVTALGGDMDFKPWWDARGACQANCSFVSGETSSAVWLAAPALLVPAPWRYAALGGVAIYASAIAFMRLLLGGHFLSDVIFAAIFTGLVIWAVHGLLFRWRLRPSDQAIDAWFERAGHATRRVVAAIIPFKGARRNEPAPPA
jgi:lipid A 4'-phosphatase